MRQKLLYIFTPIVCTWIIGITLVLADIPIPAHWDIVLDSRGATLSDKQFYVAVYLMLTVLFIRMSITTKYLFYIIVAWLSWGKLIDQFYNPYNWHIAEKIWDILILLYLTKEIHGKRSRKHTSRII